MEGSLSLGLEYMQIELPQLDPQALPAPSKLVPVQLRLGQRTKGDLAEGLWEWPLPPYAVSLCETLSQLHAKESSLESQAQNGEDPRPELQANLSPSLSPLEDCLAPTTTTALAETNHPLWKQPVRGRNLFSSYSSVMSTPSRALEMPAPTPAQTPTLTTPAAATSTPRCPHARTKEPGEHAQLCDGDHRHSLSGSEEQGEPGRGQRERPRPDWSPDQGPKSWSSPTGPSTSTRETFTPNLVYQLPRLRLPVEKVSTYIDSKSTPPYCRLPQTSGTRRCCLRLVLRKFSKVRPWLWGGRGPGPPGSGPVLVNSSASKTGTARPQVMRLSGSVASATSKAQL
ncbi:hypothetical protein J4Q44_G00252300 [Coregonus suidteri]|uniref:Uncharacterized protein n=1 Tax=Coregonus suidteri TaxID=861788 RepID=A0AAN8L0A4_9TELE